MRGKKRRLANNWSVILRGRNQRILLTSGPVLLLLRGTLWAVDCQQTVMDQARVLDASAVERLEKGSVPLRHQGVEVHLFTTTLPSESNLDFAEKSLERSCPGWQASDGGRKNTLLVLAVAPQQHKLGLYYGGAWDHALGEHWNQIKSDYMAPHFRDGDWVGGFLAAEAQISQRITASEQVASPTTTIIQQPEPPVDYSRLWTLLDWGVGLGFLLIFLLVIGRAWRRLSQQRESAKDAQQAAITTRNLVTNRLQQLNEKLSDYEAQGGEHLAQVKPMLATATDACALRLNSPNLDPDQEGLTEGQYRHIQKEYESVGALLDPIQKLLDHSSLGEDWVPENTQETAKHPTYTCQKCGRGYGLGDFPFCPHGRMLPQATRAHSRASDSTASNTPAAVGSNSHISASPDHGFLNGFVVGNALGISSCSSSDYGSSSSSSSWNDSSSSSSGGSDSWGSGGGSSDWGSSSDYGGSSDFGSSSSGGGSSDY